MQSRIFKCEHHLTAARPREMGNFKEEKNPQGRQAHKLFISQLEGGQHPHHCAVKALLSLFIKKQYLPAATHWPY